MFGDGKRIHTALLPGMSRVWSRLVTRDGPCSIGTFSTAGLSLLTVDSAKVRGSEPNKIG